MSSKNHQFQDRFFHCENGESTNWLLIVEVRAHIAYVQISQERTSDHGSGLSIDIGSVYQEICENYTERLIALFHKIVPQEDLVCAEKYGFAPDALECELMKRIFNTKASEHLLIDELFRKVDIESLGVTKVFVGQVDAGGGIRRAMAKRYFNEISENSPMHRVMEAARRKIFVLLGYCSYAAAAFMSIVLVLLSMLRLEKTVFSGAEGDNVCLLHDKVDNRASDLIKMIETEDKKKHFVALLGSGIRGVPKVFRYRKNIIVIRPWARKHVLRAIFSTAKLWPTYLEYAGRIARHFRYSTIPFPMMFGSGLSLVRGQLHRYWVESHPALGIIGEAKLDWSGYADVTEFDLAMQRKGVRTVHYLHGIIGDPIPYWGVSTCCVCKTLADVKLLKSVKVGRYKRILRGGCDDIRDSVGDASQESILILTNLIHPANYRYRYIAERLQSSLFDIVAEANEAQLPVIWRPHPEEARNKRAFQRLASQAAAFGFLMDSDDSLERQLTRAKYIITVFSSVLADIVLSGKIPYVFSGVPYENTPGWLCISEDCKFGVRDRLKTMMRPEYYDEAWRRHFAQMYENFCHERKIKRF